MARKCGYCREYNHDKSKCPTLKAEITSIRKYVPAELWSIHNAIVKAGFGLGAIVQVTDWAGKEKICIIDDLNFDIGYSQIIDYRIIKYSKRVRTLLKNFSGLNRDFAGIPANVQFAEKSEISIPVLDPSNTASRLYATFTRHSLGITNAAPIYSWSDPAKLMSPSYESNMTYQDFIDRSIHLHDRLIVGRNDSYVKGLAI